MLSNQPPRLRFLPTRLVLAWLMIPVWLAPDVLAAQSPLVHFDMNPVVACRDVTTPEFQAANPDERLVEVEFEISALIHQGNEDDLLEFFYRFELQEPAVSVVDYAPKTTLASDQASNVTLEQRSEKSNHLGLVLTSPLDWPGKLTASSDLGQKTLDSTRYELVPQMAAITASGTVQRGRGVYFKLKPSRSQTLEGARQFSVVLRVPVGWRGGYAYLNCTATGISRGLVRTLDEQIVCGTRRFVVALYVEGDAEAKAAAQRLVQAETDLRQVISTRRAEIERMNRPTLRHRLESVFSLPRPAIAAPSARAPADGRHNRTTVSTGRSAEVSDPQPAPSGVAKLLPPLADRLPAEVQQAVTEYQSARSQLRFLANGTAQLQ